MAMTVKKRNNISIGLSERQLYAYDQRPAFEVDLNFVQDYRIHLVVSLKSDVLVNQLEKLDRIHLVSSIRFDQIGVAHSDVALFPSSWYERCIHSSYCYMLLTNHWATIRILENSKISRVFLYGRIVRVA